MYGILACSQVSYSYNTILISCVCFLESLSGVCCTGNLKFETLYLIIVRCLYYLDFALFGRVNECTFTYFVISNNNGFTVIYYLEVIVVNILYKVVRSFSFLDIIFTVT